MKKSLKIFLLIAVLFFAADRLVSAVLNHFQEKVYSGQGVGKVNVFLQVKDSVDLIVLGSSRSAHHIDPSSIEISMFNMGVDGTKIAYAAALAETLHKKNQVIMVHVDPELIFSSSYKGEDALRLSYLSLLNDDVQGFFEKHFRSEAYLSKLSHSYAFNGKLLPVLKNTMVKEESYFETKGFQPLNPTAEQSKLFKEIVAREGDSLLLNNNIEKPLKVNEIFQSYVDELFQRSNKNQSKLIFFTSPSLTKVDEEVRHAIIDFFSERGLNYWYGLDFFEQVDFSYWKDRTHLTAKGASVYSAHINERLKAQ